MTGWQTHRGAALGLPFEDIDTDQLIPARFMSRPRTDGYGAFLLHDLRHDISGVPKDFPLNRHPHVSILIAGANFGSGSSREAAVYALVDFGIRAVFAPSFGDIFAGNAVNNGLLAATIPPDIFAQLQSMTQTAPCPAQIDLADGTGKVGDIAFRFSLDETARTKLINGWDDIDMTAQHSAAIAGFSQRHRDQHPWAWPSDTAAPG